jgi:hypothetical protein
MKKRKFAEGGYQDMSDMTPADVAEMKLRSRSSKAYNNAMPDPYEEGLYSKEKRRAALEAVMNTPKDMAKGLMSKAKEIADSDTGKKLMRAARFAVETNPMVAGAQPALAVAEYGIDKLKEKSANRKRNMGENTNPAGDTFKRGGKVSSASKRADGIATKGKTKGTMIAMRNGGKC